MRTADRETTLLQRARAGDAAGLALAFERWRPRLVAAGLRLLGDHAAAQDAAQETFLVALARFGELRDDQAFGGWLLAILRNHCLMQLRSRRHEERIEEVDERALIDTEFEQRLGRHALREWVQATLWRLPEPYKLAALLRYFSGHNSYAEIATLLDIPIGTVRSRLAEAKQRLADALLGEAGLDEPRDEPLARERLEQYTEAFSGLEWRRRELFTRSCRDDVQLMWAYPQREPSRLQGRAHIEADLRDDLACGVRYTVERALGDARVSILEVQLHNDPQFPDHCPPGATLLAVHGAHGIERAHIHLTPRPPPADG